MHDFTITTIIKECFKNDKQRKFSLTHFHNTEQDLKCQDFSLLHNVKYEMIYLYDINYLQK